MSNYQYKVNGVDYNVEIQDIENNIAHVSVNGKVFEIEMPETMKAPVTVKKEAKPVEQKPAAKPSGKGTKVVAPLPGTITEVKVAIGDTVKTGDTVIILEAMKMQNNIEAEADGTITEIHVSKGDTVMEGNPLVTIG